MLVVATETVAGALIILTVARGAVLGAWGGTTGIAGWVGGTAVSVGRSGAVGGGGAVSAGVRPKSSAF